MLLPPLEPPRLEENLPSCPPETPPEARPKAINERTQISKEVRISRVFLRIVFSSLCLLAVLYMHYVSDCIKISFLLRANRVLHISCGLNSGALLCTDVNKRDGSSVGN